MKIIREADEIHDCGRELRANAESKVAVLKDQLGKVAECSCGRRFELRKSGFFRFLFGVEPFGHEESSHPMLAYWHNIGRSDPR